MSESDGNGSDSESPAPEGGSTGHIEYFVNPPSPREEEIVIEEEGGSSNSSTGTGSSEELFEEEDQQKKTNIHEDNSVANAVMEELICEYERRKAPDENKAASAATSEQSLNNQHAQSGLGGLLVQRAGLVGYVLQSKVLERFKQAIEGKEEFTLEQALGALSCLSEKSDNWRAVHRMVEDYVERMGPMHVAMTANKLRERINKNIFPNARAVLVSWAKEYCEEAARRKSIKYWDDVEELDLRLHCALGRDDYADAYDTLTRLLEVFPEESLGDRIKRVKFVIDLTTCCSKLDKESEALKHYKEAIALCDAIIKHGQALPAELKEAENTLLGEVKQNVRSSVTPVRAYQEAERLFCRLKDQVTKVGQLRAQSEKWQGDEGDECVVQELRDFANKYQEVRALERRDVTVPESRSSDANMSDQSGSNGPSKIKRMR